MGPPGAAVPAAVLPASGEPAPERLHPSLWRADGLVQGLTGGVPGLTFARAFTRTFASGFDALDTELPGGGWPAGALTELLLPHPGLGELRLLAPTLAALQGLQRERCVMWFDPPAEPCAWALQSLGLHTRQLVVVRSELAPSGRRRTRAERAGRAGRAAPAQAHRLWALEHALRSGHVGAVLAWLASNTPADALRRLQLAAQAHEGPAFVLRDESAALQPSPAPLRLHLAAAGPDGLRVTVLKRRGPPLERALTLQLAPVLGASALARAHAGSRVPGPAPANRGSTLPERQVEAPLVQIPSR